MTKITSGWAVDRIPFSERARRNLGLVLQGYRDMIVLPKNASKGFRFKDDAAILARLESMFGEWEFLANMGPCICRALEDAAQADWWYQKEKDYTDYEENDECEEEHE